MKDSLLSTIIALLIVQISMLSMQILDLGVKIESRPRNRREKICMFVHRLVATGAMIHVVWIVVRSVR